MTRSRRFSIAGLLGLVLVVSLGLAALTSGSVTWASAMFLVTCGVLALGLVGAVCGGAPDRAWWLGFFVFGAGYLSWAYSLPWDLESPSGFAGLLRLGNSIGLSLPARHPSTPYDADSFSYVAHCLLGLSAAVFGGALARFLFPPTSQPGNPRRGTSALVLIGKAWQRTGITAGAGLLSLTVAIVGSRSAPGLWAGATILLSWGLLGLAALGAVFNRGISQARWLGAALFGMGYLALVSGHFDQLVWPQYATYQLLDSARAYLPTVPDEHPAPTDPIAAANLRIVKALDQAVPIHFPDDTPLDEVLASIRAAIRERNGHELPIYVDPTGLQNAEKTLRSPVALDLEGVPLRTTLQLIVDQLGMVYEIDGGLIKITSWTSFALHHEPNHPDPFLLTGQCFLALVAAGLGSLLAPLVIARGNNPTAVS